MKGNWVQNHGVGAARWHLCLNPSFSPESFYNSLPFRSEHAMWGAENTVLNGTKYPIFSKQPVVGHGDHPQLLLQAPKKNFPQQLGEGQVIPGSANLHLDQEHPQSLLTNSPLPPRVNGTNHRTLPLTLDLPNPTPGSPSLLRGVVLTYIST